MAQSLDCTWWKLALAHLERDDKLASIIASSREQHIALVKCNCLFHAIVRAILGQQVSTKRAQNLWFKTLSSWQQSEVQSLEQFFLSLPLEEVKAFGISTSKARALKEVSSQGERMLVRPYNK